MHRLAESDCRYIRPRACSWGVRATSAKKVLFLTVIVPPLAIKEVVTAVARINWRKKE